MACKNIVMVESYYSAIERKTCALHVKCACVVMHIKTIQPCKFYFDYLSLQKSSISSNHVKITTHRNLNDLWKDSN
jgi:tRNA(Leu) C34 or U34 (ribose-2'-O)-methylase TrmL